MLKYIRLFARVNANALTMKHVHSQTKVSYDAFFRLTMEYILFYLNNNIHIYTYTYIYIYIYREREREREREV